MAISTSTAVTGADAIKAFCLAVLVCFTPAAVGAVQPVDESHCTAMKAHHVMSDHAPVGCDRLRLVTFRYIDFSGASHDGKIVVLDALAPRVERIFEALYVRRFPIAKANLLEAYEGDDDASMADDNTSSFNDRPVTGGSLRSLHAYGAAIDLNPVQNPFIRRAGTMLSVDPPSGIAYVNRAQSRPGKADRPGLAEAAADIFAANGFTVWGGYWDEPLDYQHFDIGRPLAEELARLPPAQAAERFEQAVEAYCRAHSCVAQQP